MPYRICKSFDFESGHMLSKHPGKCRSPHGHSRTVEVVLAADRLDEHDMVCDFKAIRDALKEFLERMDHALCLNTDDANFGFYRDTYGAQIIPFAHADPTSELMAKAIFDELKRRLADGSVASPGGRAVAGVRIERVRLSETRSTWAEYFE